MTLDQAKQERDKHMYLIGEPIAPNSIHKVSDIIVTPDDMIVEFTGKYIDYKKRLTNDDLIAGFPSREYSVHLIAFYEEIGLSLIKSNLTDYLEQMNQH